MVKNTVMAKKLNIENGTKYNDLTVIKEAATHELPSGLKLRA